jgi:Ca2+-binding EF-hand superfamily protein
MIMRFGVSVLFFLFACLPGLAQEKAPVDPLEGLLAVYRYQCYDEDGDGKLNADERAALTTFLLRDFDLNGDKALDERELLIAKAFCLFSWYCDGNDNSRMERSERESLLAGLLASGDADLNGKLSLEELRDTVEFSALLASERGQLDWAMQVIGQNGAWKPFIFWKAWQGQKFLELLEKHDESVHAGRVNVAGLKREIECLSPFDQLVVAWPDYDVDNNQHWDRAERAQLIKAFGKTLDLNGDGAVSLEELQETGLRFAFMQQLNRQATPEEKRRWLTPEARREFDATYLAAHAANRNGKWEPEELLAGMEWEGEPKKLQAELEWRWVPEELLAGMEWETLLMKAFRAHPEFDVDGDKSMSPGERSALVAWVIENRDAGANGVLDPKRMDACVLEELLLQVGTAADPQKRAGQRAKLLAVCDLNHNGRFELGEAKVARTLYSSIIKDGDKPIERCRELVVAEADRNHDGILDRQEAEQFVRREFAWTALLGRYRQIDLDRDGFLSLKERAVVTQASLQRYDLNGNGRLELCELSAKWQDGYNKKVAFVAHRCYSALLGQALPLYTDEEIRLCEFATCLCDIDGDGVLDAEELVVLEKLGEFLDQSPPAKLPRGTLDAGKVRTFLNQALRQYDADKDGKLNGQEMQTGLLLTMALHSFLNSIGGNEAAARELDPNDDGVVSEAEQKAFFASLLPDFDANHNGRIEPTELQEKIWFEFLLIENLNEFQIPRNAAGRMDAAARKTLLEKLVKRYDLNGDGKMDLSELQVKDQTDSMINGVSFLYPGFEAGENWILTEEKRIALETLLLKDYDRNHDGRLDLFEITILYHKLEGQAKVAEQKFRQHQEEEQVKAELAKQEAIWLKKYDFNGNGQLDPEERQRAEADAKAGIQAPARDE